MLRKLDYQARVLKIFDHYLTELIEARTKATKIEAHNAAQDDPELLVPIPDFAGKAWKAMEAAGRLPPSRQHVPFSSRQDGIGRQVPNAVFKVPTGGGKTLLAVSALSELMGRYVGSNAGFVLWIVPNEAIYTQTKKQLTDRQHPYRQILDQAAAGRVRLLEKGDPLNVLDVESGLCVMLLMLQSAARQTKETLKLFQDRGDVRGFFPPEGDQEAHLEALMRTPNLDRYDLADGQAGWPMIKDSLGNALRLIRPVVVMDEGHRAISEIAFRTLYGFNPCFVLELSATPKDVVASRTKPARPANVLVEVLGTELDREGMIKMPLNLDARRGSDWRDTLRVALERLNELERAARVFQADSGRYIRPIMLVQVERTGADQREGNHIHALDVKEWLANTVGFDNAEIAVKTAETNDLNAPENQDLLLDTNRVRVIITKQALQEGWDCPFAYVLCALAASSNRSGMTQLVGRILRQPHAQRTGVPLLDESYVITHHATTAEVVAAIKTGLESDGLGDLVREIKTAESSDGEDGGAAPVRIQRRPALARTEIYLPLVLRVDGATVRRLDYEADVLAAVDWSGVDTAALVASIPDNWQPAEPQLRRIRLVDGGTERIVAEDVGPSGETLAFDPAYAVRMILDIVPNPWIGREIVGHTLAGLAARGFDSKKIGRTASFIVDHMRRWLGAKRDELAELKFRDAVATGEVQFRLRVDGRNWRMPKTTETSATRGARHLLGADGDALKRSLFAPMFEVDFNTDERDVAVYLDGEAALRWWHRNVAREQYSLQAWRREKIYPDFIFAVARGRENSRIAVLETKGDHLAGNEDTLYKQKVLELMSQNFAWDVGAAQGRMQLINPTGDSVECALVLMQDWKQGLPLLLQATGQQGEPCSATSASDRTS
jgi:type III restriction enzyme